MPNVGEQGDIFRALGHFLDSEGATQFDIKSHEVFLAVSWTKGEPGATERAYQDQDLEKLRDEAKALRLGSLRGIPGGTYAELLRTLGQQLDREGLEVTSIISDEDGFRVAGIGRGRYRTINFLKSELMDASAGHRTARKLELHRVTKPFNRISKGALVYTSDDQRIGKVGEIGARSFKVDTPLLQRDYWLPADVVAAAEVDRPVRLSIAKAEVDRHKASSAID